MNNEDQTLKIGSRALVFGGAYGNLQATQAILTYAKTHGYEPGQIIFTGDLVAYCGQPQETSDLIRSSGCHTIMGNCEEALAADSDNCGCGFEEGTQCSILSDQWFSFCQSALNTDTKRWMGTLPLSLRLQVGNFTFLCTHGTTQAINQFVFPSDIADKRYRIPHNKDIDGYIVGHSGIPFIAQDSGMIWINSGAAGMPANDGSPKVWFATLEVEGDGILVQTHAIEYAHEEASEAMAVAGLENGYRDCLSSGIWPSLDILPEIEKNQTGSRIEPHSERLQNSPAFVVG